MVEPMTIEPTPGAKMQYLIRRRAGVSREDLIANWFANHMPEVIAGQIRSAERGRPAASRYIATVFEPQQVPASHGWDGVAQLWFDAPLPRPEWPHGDPPRDTFQERAEPYVPWPTRELVVLDGLIRVEPNSFGKPFPCTRSGFVKATTLFTAKPGVDHDDLFRHWTDVHAPNVRSALEATGGLRYVINQSLEPHVDPYLGSAEVWFPDDDARRAFNEAYVSDGIEDMVGDIAFLTSRTEMIGIP